MKIAIIADYNNKTWVWSQNYNLYRGLNELWVETEIINLVSPQWFKGIPTYWKNIVSSLWWSTYLSFAYGVFFKFPKGLSKLISKEKYDIVILWHQWLAYLSSTLSTLNVNYLIIVDDLFSLYEYAKWVNVLIYNKLLLKNLKNIENISFISDYTKHDYEHYYGGLNQKKTITIPIGVSDEHQKNTIEKPYIDKLVLQNKKIILNVWSEDIRKNIKTFLEIANYYKDDERMVFIRVWKPSVDSQAYIAQHKLDNLLYVSWLSVEELFSLYKSSYIVLSPSTLEGFWKQIFEGYLFNNFIISTNVSDVAQIFEKDPNVFIVHNPKSLSEYTGPIDKIFNQNLIFKAITQIQSVETESQQYLEFIKEIL